MGLIFLTHAGPSGPKGGPGALESGGENAAPPASLRDAPRRQPRETLARLLVCDAGDRQPQSVGVPLPGASAGTGAGWALPT